MSMATPEKKSSQASNARCNNLDLCQESQLLTAESRQCCLFRPSCPRRGCNARETPLGQSAVAAFKTLRKSISLFITAREIFHKKA